MIKYNSIIIKIRTFLENKNRNYLIITQAINALLGLIVGKLIAEFIIPEELGLYNIQFAIFSFFMLLFISPSIQFLKSTYFSFVQKIGIKFYFITLGWLCFLMFFALLLFFSVYKPETFYNKNLTFIFFLIIPLTAFSNILLDQFNVFNKIELFSIQSISSSLTGLIFLIVVFYLFTEVEKNSFILWLMQFFSLVISVIVFIKKYKFVLNKSRIVTYRLFLIKHFRFTFPLMFLALWSWLNSYFDRFVLEHFMTLKDVGVYNANYGLGSKFFLVIYPVFLVLLTPYVYNDNSIRYKKNIILSYSKNYLILGTVVLFIIFVFRKNIGSILLSNSYSDGFNLIFWIALAYFIITATYLFESIFYAYHKTKIILFGTVLCAIVSLVLNLTFVQQIGIYAAVLAVICSSLVRLMYIFYKFQKL